MAYTTDHLRRAYFAVIKSLGMSEDDRHAFNLAFVGKESTRNWGRRDWKDAVAELQRMAGQRSKPGRPRLRADKPSEVSVEDGLFATARQCEMIEDLCDQVEWRLGREEGPRAYVLKHFLGDKRFELVKMRLRTEGWTALPRDVASGLIQALKRMKDFYPIPTTTAEL